MKRKQLNLVAVIFTITLVCLAALVFVSVYLYIQNVNLRNSMIALEEKTFSLMDDTKRSQESKLLADDLESRVLDYLEWRFVVKEQTRQAAIRLSEAATKVKELKKDKTLLNLFYYNLGLSYILSQDFNAAIEAFKQGLEYKPNDAWSSYNLGLLYSVAGRDNKKAALYYNKYLESDPSGIYAADVKLRLEELKDTKRKGQ
jgi:tetratricopeptide (TPR) repeat protein